MLFLTKVSDFLVFFSSIFIHEIFHLIVALTFKIKKWNIKVTMIGTVLFIDNTDELNKTKKMILYLAGVVGNVLILILNRIYIYDIDIDLYNSIKEYNKLLIIFSLLPIYPLDGFNLISIFIKSNIISYVSLGILFITILFFESYGLLIISLFLLFQNLKLNKIKQTNYLKKILNKEMKRYVVRSYNFENIYK